MKTTATAMSNQLLPATGYYILSLQDSKKMDGLRVWKTPIIGWQVNQDGIAKPISLSMFGTHSENIYLLPNGEILEPNGELFRDEVTWLADREYKYVDVCCLKSEPKRWEARAAGQQHRPNEPAWMNQKPQP